MSIHKYETLLSETKKSFMKKCFAVCKQNFCKLLFVYKIIVYKRCILFQTLYKMKKLRAQLALTQTDMARLMGSSKTKASLYEKGLRSLNAKELNMLSTIELLMSNPAEIQATDKISLNDQKALVAVLKKLAYDQKRAAQQHEIISEKLSRMEETYASNRKLWRLLNELKTNLKGAAANPYAAVLEIRCLEKLKSCGLHQQILLRHQLSMLASEIASAQQLVEEYWEFGVPVEG